MKINFNTSTICFTVRRIIIKIKIIVHKQKLEKCRYIARTFMFYQLYLSTGICIIFIFAHNCVFL